MIQHTVTFRLNDDVELAPFLERAKELAALPGVQNFEVLEQVGTKATQFTHALSMWFDTGENYARYNDHASHVDFVENTWIPNVAEFLELDYLRMSP